MPGNCSDAFSGKQFVCSGASRKVTGNSSCDRVPPPTRDSPRAPPSAASPRLSQPLGSSAPRTHLAACFASRRVVLRRPPVAHRSPRVPHVGDVLVNSVFSSRVLPICARILVLSANTRIDVFILLARLPRPVGQLAASCSNIKNTRSDEDVSQSPYILSDCFHTCSVIEVTKGRAFRFFYAANYCAVVFLAVLRPFDAQGLENKLGENWFRFFFRTADRTF
ncbi:hypothetical protein V9T40_008035 [Parthenolecanium corni]|uniref:Uncharacterized protein n=1 Tax=Parthenolecanium corni TaxID=536013 RepID=A0AAN9TT77_9HEMI